MKVLDAVGITPMVRLRRASEASGDNLYAKLEFMNPGDSVKERLVKCPLSEMECAGDLTAHAVLVGNFSGNTGAALSMAAAVTGLRCLVMIPDKMSRENKRTEDRHDFSH